MSFTFPTDSNNKAGAVKSKNAGASFVVPSQYEVYDIMEVKRQTLVTNTDTAFTLSSVMDSIEIQNLGSGDIYVKLDAVASVDGADCILIVEGSGFRFPIKGTVVHVISTGTPKVQVIGSKNN